MKTSNTEKYTIFKAENNFKNFYENLKTTFNTNTENSIIDLSDITVTELQVTSLEEFADLKIKNNKSFVIILPAFNADAFEEKLNVVPTLIEAEDIIDMDEMTRDLGF